MKYKKSLPLKSNQHVTAAKINMPPVQVLGFKERHATNCKAAGVLKRKPRSDKIPLQICLPDSNLASGRTRRMRGAQTPACLHVQDDVGGT